MFYLVTIHQQQEIKAAVKQTKMKLKRTNKIHVGL